MCLPQQQDSSYTHISVPHSLTVYTASKYSTISGASNISTPVLGSTRNGTWNRPVFSTIRSRFADPREQLTMTWGRQRLPNFSLTGRTNGEHSYPHS
mmetsp:Transcript_35260/g.105341  ORF Transcript_35260/g.105341 Transcript_35260/m.105341 type:complete len:97 (+) Transcript_35260:294-584(+)